MPEVQTKEARQSELAKFICDEIMYMPTTVNLTELRNLKFKGDMNGDPIDLICVYITLEDDYGIILADYAENDLSDRVATDNKDITLGELIDQIMEAEQS